MASATLASSMEEQSARQHSDRQPRQRWQIVFSRTRPVLHLRQEEVLEAFERAFRDSGLPLSTTNAKRPRPRLTLAANLPTGIEAHGEVLEVFFDELLPVEQVRAAGELLPEGLRIVEARDVWQGFPSAASRLLAAEYEVEVTSSDALTEDALRSSLERLLAERRLPGMRRRGETERRADAGERDLRPLIDELRVESVNSRDRGPGDGNSAEAGDGSGRAAASARLSMVLRAGATGSARPEDVVAALDLPLRVTAVARRRLHFVDTPRSQG